MCAAVHAGFDVNKVGDARVGFVGFPSVGKSTLLTKLTGTYSEVSWRWSKHLLPFTLASFHSRTCSQPARASSTHLSTLSQPAALHVAHHHPWLVALQAASYEFTTLTCIPGIVRYRGAKMQFLDLPGIIEGAKDGKGRGRQVRLLKMRIAGGCGPGFSVLLF